MSDISKIIPSNPIINGCVVTKTSNNRFTKSCLNAITATDSLLSQYSNRFIYQDIQLYPLNNIPTTAEPLDTSSIYTNWLGGRSLTYGGLYNYKPSYYYGNEKIYWNGSFWGMYNNTYGVDDLYGQSNDDVFYPWLATSWTTGEDIFVIRIE